MRLCVDWAFLPVFLGHPSLAGSCVGVSLDSALSKSVSDWSCLSGCCVMLMLCLSRVVGLRLRSVFREVFRSRGGVPRGVGSAF